MVAELQTWLLADHGATVSLGCLWARGRDIRVNICASAVGWVMAGHSALGVGSRDGANLSGERFTRSAVACEYCRQGGSLAGSTPSAAWRAGAKNSPRGAYHAGIGPEALQGSEGFDSCDYTGGGKSSSNWRRLGGVTSRPDLHIVAVRGSEVCSAVFT